VSSGLGNFLFAAVNFLLLVAGLGWLVAKPVRRAIDEERERRTKEDAERVRLRADADALLESARGEREEAVRRGEEQRNEIVAAARTEAATLLDAARKARAEERQALARELEAARSAQIDALSEVVGRITAESVTQLLATLPGPSLDAALVRTACEKLGELPAEDLGSALVESARPLDDDARSALEAVLGRGFRLRTLAELGAGVRITTAAGQVDASALSIAREAGRSIVAEPAPVSDALRSAHA
jgi:F0F1-type ATP synthase membrane subunit b/b'